MIQLKKNRISSAVIFAMILFRKKFKLTDQKSEEMIEELKRRGVIEIIETKKEPAAGTDQSSGVAEC